LTPLYQTQALDDVQETASVLLAPSPVYSDVCILYTRCIDALQNIAQQVVSCHYLIEPSVILISDQKCFLADNKQIIPPEAETAVDETLSDTVDFSRRFWSSSARRC